MAEEFIRVNPDSTGKAVETEEVTEQNGTVVERQDYVLADPTVEAAKAQVLNYSPTGGEYGLVVRPIGNTSAVNLSGALPAGSNTIGNVGIVGSITIANPTSVQAVSGALTVLNFPSSQIVSGTVAVSNQPAFVFDSSGNLKTTSSSSTVSVSNQPNFNFDGTGRLLVTTTSSSSGLAISSLPAVTAGTGFPGVTTAGTSATALLTVQGAASGTALPISGLVAISGTPRPLLSAAGTPASGLNLLTVQGASGAYPVPVTMSGQSNISGPGVAAASATNVQFIPGGTPVSVTGNLTATTVFPYSGSTDTQAASANSAIGHVGWNGLTWDRVRVAAVGASVPASATGIQVVQGIGAAGAIPVIGSFSASASVVFPYSGTADAQAATTASLVGLAGFNGTTFDRVRAFTGSTDAVSATAGLLGVGSFNYGWNGTSWDRARSQTINAIPGFMGTASVLRDPYNPTSYATVSQFHLNDNLNAGGTAFGLFTSGGAQLLNAGLNYDRQRETGIDLGPRTRYCFGLQSACSAIFPLQARRR